MTRKIWIKFLLLMERIYRVFELLSYPKKIITSLAIICSAIILIISNFTAETIDCDPVELNFLDIEHCVFNQERASKQFFSKHIGRKIRGKSHLRQVLAQEPSADNNDSGIIFLLGNWGPQNQLGVNSIIICDREISDKNIFESEKIYYMNIKENTEVFFTGIISDISRNQLRIKRCEVITL